MSHWLTKWDENLTTVMPECFYPSPSGSIGDRNIRGRIQRLLDVIRTKTERLWIPAKILRE